MRILLDVSFEDAPSVDIVVCDDRMELCAISDALERAISYMEHFMDKTDMMDWDILHRYQNMYKELQEAL